MVSSLPKKSALQQLGSREARYAALAILAALLVVPFFVSNSYYIQVLILMLLYAYLALAWNIVGGMAGQVSFGHGIFFGVGAYISTIIFRDLGWSPWLGMFVGAAAAMIAALALGYPCFRLRGPYFSLATLAFQEIVRSVVNNTNDIFGVVIRGSRGILLPLKGNAPLLFQFDDKRYFYYIILAFLLIQLVVVYFLKRGKFGMYLAAIKNNEDAAAVLGINAAKMKLYALLISAAFTAIGGTFYVQLIHFIEPEIAFGSLSLTFVLYAISGGTAYLLGPVVGTMLLMPFAEFTRVAFAGKATGIHMVIYGIVMVLVMIFMPKGILHEVQAIYNRLRSKGKNPPTDDATPSKTEANHGIA